MEISNLCACDDLVWIVGNETTKAPPRFGSAKVCDGTIALSPLGDAPGVPVTLLPKIPGMCNSYSYVSNFDTDRVRFLPIANIINSEF